MLIFMIRYLVMCFDKSFPLSVSCFQKLEYSSKKVALRCDFLTS